MDTLSSPYTSGSLAHAYPLSGNSQTFTAAATFVGGATAGATCSMTLVARTFAGYSASNTFNSTFTASGSTGSPTLTLSNASVLSGTSFGAGLQASGSGRTFGPFTPTGGQYICIVQANTVSNPGGGSFTVGGITFPMSLVQGPVSWTNLFGGSPSSYAYCSTGSFVSGTYNIAEGT